MERKCKNCGSSMTEIEGLETSYPDRRKDRDQTTRKVFKCESCDSEGRKFEDGKTGNVTFSGALR